MSENNDEAIVIDVGGGKMLVLKISNFDDEVIVEDILRIDYSNILGEILTFSLIFNRIANWKAETDNAVISAKMDFEVLEAQMAELYRLENIIGEADAKGNIKYKKPSEKEIENYVLTDEKIIERRKKYFELLKKQGYIESLYWSAKDKSDKLNKLTDKIRPEEFANELLEDTINGVMIKQRNKVINN